MSANAAVMSGWQVGICRYELNAILWLCFVWDVFWCNFRALVCRLASAATLYLHMKWNALNKWAVTKQLTKNIVGMIWNFWVNKCKWTLSTTRLHSDAKRPPATIRYKRKERYAHNSECTEHVHQVGVRDSGDRSYDPQISDLIEPTNNRVIYL